ncbi:hypothetical protein [Mycobacteroides abscessus]|uniref:hypothetical protein n=1 Tax=Mycobacteroides abscessus TaxID=36809 RepID=UPI0013FD07B8|nr:hypothetical protein [Mycobacteroides abscessus]
MVHVQFDINVIRGPAAADHAPVLISLEHLHAELSRGCTPHYRIVIQVPDGKEAPPTCFHGAVMHALTRTNHIRQVSLSNFLYYQCVSAYPKENGKRTIVMHDQPALIGLFPEPHHPICAHEVGPPDLPAGITFGPTHPLGLGSPNRLASPIRP